MKVLILSDIQDHGKKCAEGLLKLGHEVIYVYPRNAITECVELNDKIKLIELPHEGKKGYFLNSFALRRICHEIKPDVIHVHYASGFGLLSTISRIRPTALSCYGSDIFEFPNLNRFNYYILRFILNHADVLQSTSHAMADEVRRIIGDKSKRVDIIPFGVNTSLFRPQENKQRNKVPVLGYIKSLNQIYDVPLLINAFAIVYNKTTLKPVLKIYGDGPLRSELEALCKKLGIENAVQFKGRVSNELVPQVLNGMDILINCSIQESFGVNILEAMSCEVPVIATDCVGPKEIILDEETGIIIKDRRPETMASSIIELLNDEPKRLAMGKAGRLRVIELYDWQNNIIELEKSLKDINK